MSGVIEDIFVGATKREPVRHADAVEISPSGIVGDRYAAGVGSFSKPIEAGDAGRHVTLIEAEAIETAGRDFAVDWSAGLHRRNLVTRGITLNGLINRRLQIGEVILRCERHCHPCRHLEKLTKLEAMRSLQMRGGLRTRVLRGGWIRVGDRVEVLEGQRQGQRGEQS